MKKLLFIGLIIAMLSSCDSSYVVTHPYYSDRTIVYRSPYYYHYYRPYGYPPPVYRPPHHRR